MYWNFSIKAKAIITQWLLLKLDLLLKPITVLLTPITPPFFFILPQSTDDNFMVNRTLRTSLYLLFLVFYPNPPTILSQRRPQWIWSCTPFSNDFDGKRTLSLSIIHRIPATQEATNSRPFKDFLMPKVKTFKTNYSIQKFRKRNP